MGEHKTNPVVDKIQEALADQREGKFCLQINAIAGLEFPMFWSGMFAANGPILTPFLQLVCVFNTKAEAAKVSLQFKMFKDFSIIELKDEESPKILLPH